MTDRKLSRKELYSGSLVIFIATFYLLSSAAGLFQQGASFRNFNEVKMLLLSLFYLAAGILLLSRKNAGWIFSAAILLHFFIVIFSFIVSLSQSGILNAASGMTIFLIFLVFLGLIFLFGRETRKKFLVTNKSYLISLVIYLLLLFVNFRL